MTQSLVVRLDARIGNALAEGGFQKGEVVHNRINQMAFALMRDRRYLEAIEIFNDALKIVPNDPVMTDNLATCYKGIGERARARALFRANIEKYPNYPHSHNNLALILLADGEWEEGWREYWWRYRARQDTGKMLNIVTGKYFHQEAPPRLADVSGKRILIIGDQGLGDQIHYARFLDRLTWKASPPSSEAPCYIGLAPDRRLYDFFKYQVNEIPYVYEFPGKTHIQMAIGKRFDVCIPLSSLPLVTESFSDDMPSPLDWRHQVRASAILDGLPRPLVGVTWHAGVAGMLHKGGLHKHVDCHALMQALLGSPKMRAGTMIALQRNPTEKDLSTFTAWCAMSKTRCVDLSAVNENLGEMLYVLSELDEHIGVSNTNMHLRATAGRSSRVLLTHPAEWRWSQLCWYPDCHRYTQDADLSWRDALAQLSADLSA